MARAGVSVLARAYGRLHRDAHGCALAVCTRPPCARLAQELVPGWDTASAGTPLPTVGLRPSAHS